MPKLILACHEVSKSYLMPSGIQASILNHVNFEVQEGEQWAITGRSGSGKSTLLQILGGMDRPNSGRVSITGVSIYDLSPSAYAQLLNTQVGFVFQHHYLLGDFNALENVAMSLLIRGIAQALALERAAATLVELGLGHRLTHRPSQLSGGERQRVALARAVVGRPAVVLADEPTGNLDPETGAQVYELIDFLTNKYGMSFIIVTHDERLALTRRQAKLINGSLEIIC